MRRFHVNMGVLSLRVDQQLPLSVRRMPPGLLAPVLLLCTSATTVTVAQAPGTYSGLLAVPPALSIHLALPLSVPPSAGGISGFRSISFHWSLGARHRAKYFSSVSRYLAGRWYYDPRFADGETA